MVVISRTSALLLGLALASGMVDAASYLGLGRVFTANMTGNTVLLGVAAATGSGRDAARAASALAGFCAGVAIGVALVRRDASTWPHSARRALWFELVALAGLLVAWSLHGVGTLRYPLIAISAVAMGTQSASVRAAHPGGVATTYVTGTLTNAIARVIERPRTVGGSGAALPGGIWLLYAVGAVAGAFAEKAWHAGALAVPAAIVCVVGASAVKP